MSSVSKCQVLESLETKGPKAAYPIFRVCTLRIGDFKNSSPFPTTCLSTFSPLHLDSSRCGQSHWRIELKPINHPRFLYKFEESKLKEF